MALVFSCKKDKPLGADVQPADDLINGQYSDTATIYGFTIKYDSVRTYQDGYKYLGSNQDPIFGRTDAGIYANFTLPNNVSNISFGDDAVLDSARVYLTFTQNFVGDTNTILNYKIFGLNSTFDYVAPRYMHHNFSYNPTALCDANVKLSFNGGFHTIVLPLDYNYGSGILNNNAALVNTTAFIAAYKGLYISTKSSFLNPVSAQGALMKIDLDNPVSGVYLFYHNGAQTQSKTPKVYKFPFASDAAARFNHVDYNLSGANVYLAAQLAGDSCQTAGANCNGQQNLFLKGVGGTRAKIKIPFVRNYAKDCHIAVNRAEIVFKVDQSFITTGGQYNPPSMISLVAIDSLGKEAYLKDQYYTSDLIHFGGTYDDVNKQYVFNIARHIQDIVDGKLKNYGFYLVVANPDGNYVARRDDRAERVVLGGRYNALYAPQFKLTYIRFPNDK